MNAKLKFVALTILFAGLLVVLALQQSKLNRLTAENADLRNQLAQLTSLQENNDTLAQQLKTANTSAESNQSELLRLRAQAPRLRQLEQENATLKTEHQQLAERARQLQAAVASPTQEQTTTSPAPLNPNATNSDYIRTDLGSLELQQGVPAQFDLGGGTNCTITATGLADGNNSMAIKVGATNGTFQFNAESRLTARPGQQCSISVGDRMISLAVTLKP